MNIQTEVMLDSMTHGALKLALTAKAKGFSLRAAYNELLQKQKVLETFLDNTAVPFEKREVRLPEFKDTLTKMNGLLIEIIHSGYPLKREEVLNGFGLAANRQLEQGG